MKPLSREALVTVDFRRHLLLIFQERATARPSYSFRAFAKFLQTDPATLRKIVMGKRPLGERLIRRFGVQLKMSEEELAPFLSAYRARKKLQTLHIDESLSSHRLLTADEFKKISRWYCYAILDLLDLPSFQSDPEWIAKVLRIPLAETRRALDVLFQMEWIKITSEGGWTKNVGPTTTDPVDPGIAETRHRLMLEIANKCVDSLRHDPREIRSHSAMTVAIDRSLLPEAVEKIRAFRVDLMDFLSKGRATNEIYQIFVGLYPLSHIEDLPRKRE